MYPALEKAQANHIMGRTDFSVPSVPAKAMANPTKGVGYAYDTTRTSSQIANVDAVIQQYVPTLESGSEGDLDTTYQEFLTALEAAGINDIIADNQSQFDEWMAQQ